MILELLCTIYGTVQAAMAFFWELLKAFKFLKYNRSKADPCLHYKWTEEEKLVVWLSWVDDYVVSGHGQDPCNEKEKMKRLFDDNDLGEVTEYIGTKVDVDKDKKTIHLTQPVLIKLFEDEFGIREDGKVTTPAVPGKVLRKCSPERKLARCNTRCTEKGWEN